MIAALTRTTEHFSMSEPLSGATRVHFIVGDPIAQVKSPAGVSQTFHDRGHNAYVMPAHVAPAQLAAWLDGVSLAQNVDGVIVTVPHKFACYGLCATTSERAAFLHTVNTMRRNPDGSWHGDMFDGLGFVSAMQDNGCQPAGKKALLVGAGGAGSAIAHALVVAGVSSLAIFDPDWPAWANARSPTARPTPRALISCSTPAQWACRSATRFRWIPTSCKPACSSAA